MDTKHWMINTKVSSHLNRNVHFCDILDLFKILSAVVHLTTINK